MIFIYFLMIGLLSYLHLKQYQDVSSTAEANVKRKKKSDEYIKFIFLSTKMITLSIYYVSFVGCSANSLKSPSYRGKNNTKIVFQKYLMKNIKNLIQLRILVCFEKSYPSIYMLIDSLSIWIWCYFINLLKIKTCYFCIIQLSSSKLIAMKDLLSGKGWILSFYATKSIKVWQSIL